MNSSRRWLLIFTIVIGILVIATVSLVLLTKEKEVTLLPDNTPQGIVQRYLIAIQDEDYPKAYTYLHFEQSPKDITYNEWLSSVSNYPISRSAWKATLGKTIQNGDNATVEVIIDTFRASGPFGDVVSSHQVSFQLSKFDGKWLITSPTYIYWIY